MFKKIISNLIILVMAILSLYCGDDKKSSSDSYKCEKTAPDGYIRVCGTVDVSLTSELDGASVSVVGEDSTKVTTDAMVILIC